MVNNRILPIEYKPDNTFLNGILQKGDRTFFSVSAYSTTENYVPENALNTDLTYYHNNYRSPNWYQVTFKKYFLLKSYTIKTRHVNDDSHPCEWKIIASNDGVQWDEIDHVETYELKGLLRTKNFEITKKIIPYKYIRLVQIKSTNGVDEVFTFGALDFFGTYYHSYSLFLHKFSQRNPSSAKRSLRMVSQ